MVPQRERLADLERDAADVMDGLTPDYEAGRAHTDPLEYIEVLRDRNAINRRFAELEAQVQREILVFTKPPFARPPAENVEGLEVARSHRARSVYELSLLEENDGVDAVKRFIQAGAEARFVEKLPIKLAIIDESIVMFGMDDAVASSDAVTIVVVEHSSLAATLKFAFNAVWEQGLTFDEAVATLRIASGQPA